jgi:hypothetical protein
MDITSLFLGPAQSIADAIKGAASATGASFEYLLATAQAESGLNPHASTTTSSARGLYQFVDQTWLSTLKQFGGSLGYGQYAEAIVQTPGGRYEVPDPGMRRTIMAMRDDPAANAAMAGALTRNNAAQLATGLGRNATDGELYLAHVLGPSGALRLSTLAAVSPGTAANAVFPAAAEANRAIFYDRQGHARTVAQVYAILVGRYDGARDMAPALANGGSAASGTPSAVAVPTGGAMPSEAMRDGPDTPAEASAPEVGPLFNRLFSDRRQPAAPLIGDLWKAPAPPTQQPATASSPAKPAAPARGTALGALGRSGWFQAVTGNAGPDGP